MTVLASVIGLAGLAGLVYGIWIIFEPAGYIAGGFALLFVSWRLS